MCIDFKTMFKSEILNFKMYASHTCVRFEFNVFRHDLQFNSISDKKT